MGNAGLISVDGGCEDTTVISNDSSVEDTGERVKEDGVGLSGASEPDERFRLENDELLVDFEMSTLRTRL